MTDSMRKCHACNGEGVIEIGDFDDLGGNITNNVFFASGGTVATGHALVLPDVTGCIIAGNKFRNFDDAISVSANSDNARWAANVGSPGGLTYQEAHGARYVVPDAAAVPVLTLVQNDVDQDMIEFVSTIGEGNAIEAVGVKTLTTTHFIKVTLPGGTDALRAGWHDCIASPEAHRFHSCQGPTAKPVASRSL